MRRPSHRIRPTLVTLLHHTWGKDTDGGRRILSTVTTSDAVCSVEPGTALTVVDETGRWTTENSHTLRFNSDPNLSPHDEVIWTEVDSSRIHNLVVLGTSNKMGRGITFEVSCIERI